MHAAKPTTIGATRQRPDTLRVSDFELSKGPEPRNDPSFATKRVNETPDYGNTSVTPPQYLLSTTDANLARAIVGNDSRVSSRRVT